MILYLSSVNKYWKITPDSTTYISGAKTLAYGNGYKELGKPITLFPPMTSIVYSISSFFSNDNYFPHNLTVTILALFSLLIFYRYVINDLGKHNGLIIILLSLGSVHLYYQSTFLLSDVIYMFFSLYSIKIARDYIDNPDDKYHLLTLSFFMLATCMTRIIGLSLVISVLIYLSLSSLTKRTRFNIHLAAVSLLIIFIVLLWDYRGYLTSFSNFEIMMQKEAWVEESGYVNFLDFIERFLINSKKFLSIGNILSNGAFTEYPIINFIVNTILLLLFCTGFVVSNTKLKSITGIYTLAYLIVLASFHRSAGGYRYFVPIIPIIFYYLVYGTIYLRNKFSEHIDQRYIFATIIIYLVFYVFNGTIYMLNMIPDEHKSPFGKYPIKYPYNYDTQALALFLEKYSLPNETYVCFHPEIMNMITNRIGYHIPFSKNPNVLINLMENNNINYVLFDKKKENLAKFLIPVITTHEKRFTLLVDKENASLYRFHHK